MVLITEKRACHADEFTCQQIQQCIPLSKRCDAFTDCQDLTDETQCGEFVTDIIYQIKQFLTRIDIVKIKYRLLVYRCA